MVFMATGTGGQHCGVRHTFLVYPTQLVQEMVPHLNVLWGAEVEDVHRQWYPCGKLLLLMQLACDRQGVLVG